MLCNKADLDDSKDEVHVTNTLQVEKLVNIARCPTRVEPSVATKNQGIKEGFKWIVKTVIANISELGPRIDKDVEEEQRIEAERREEVRKRIEERKLQEDGGSGNSKTGSRDNLDEEEPPIGFVPIDEAVAAKLEEETKAIEPSPDTPIDNGDDDEEEGKVQDIEKDDAAEEQQQEDHDLINENKIAIIDDMIPPSSATEDQEAAPKPLTAPETLPPLKNGSRRNSSSSNNIKSNSSSRRNSQTNGVETFIKTGKMDLEPTNGTNGLKKAPFGRKLSNSSVKTNASSKGSGAGSRRSSKVGV